MNYYTLTPQDVLFFRDGRPTDTGGGHGAQWPEPSVIFDALHAALWRAFPEKQPEWEHDHRWGRGSTRLPQDAQRTQRFGSLVTAGLFPVVGDRWLFPAPADVTTDWSDAGKWLLAPAELRGSTNVPAPFLKYFPVSPAAPSKNSPQPWWSTRAWESYLAGTPPDAADLYAEDEVFVREWMTGIGIDPETQTQDGEHIYSAQYLRLQTNVRCGFAASLPMKRNGNRDDIHECIGRLFQTSRAIIVGGQQRACHVEPAEPGNSRSPLPVAPKVSGTRIKWVLLTPAIWPRIESNGDHPGGWLPNWIDHRTGQVLLRHRSGNVRRVWCPERKRTIRKAEVDEEISARLVAARVPKPVPVIGWTERLHLKNIDPAWEDKQPAGVHGPRPTHLAVPAGSVYYFEASSPEEAAKLAAALNWHGADPAGGTSIRNRRSTLLGEKGFGIGVCGTWSPHPASQSP